MTKKESYTLDELVAQCDPEAPRPSELKTWEETTPVGMEQDVMGDQVDIRQAVLVFAGKLRGQYEATQLILFGSRARGDYHTESDADVAVILPGNPGDFVETLSPMATLADVRFCTIARRSVGTQRSRTLAVRSGSSCGPSRKKTLLEPRGNRT
ncbi:MAG: nucleotidyltransferase domain-containing protein [Marinobacter sp.]